MKLLQIDSSILGENSVSRQLSAGLVARLREEHPDLEVVSRDLAAHPLPHVSPGHLAGDPALQAELDESGRVLAEFLAADVVVVGAPMYNFTIPSQLKTWIDRLVVAGTTFRYGENGPEGLVKGKRVIVASSRGGVYSPGSPAAGVDFQETYLRAVFGFLGITDVEFVRAEGVAMGPDARQTALDAAGRQIEALAAA